MCTNCWNTSVGGLWREVLVPDEFEAIERLLLARPKAENQNWKPDETLDQLANENILLGVHERIDGDHSDEHQADGLSPRLASSETRLWLRSLLKTPRWIRVGSGLVLSIIVMLLLAGRSFPVEISHVVAMMGLVLDVWGALLVAMPLMRRASDIVFLTRPRFDFNGPLVRSLVVDRATGTIGLAFLFAGFFCQFLAQVL